MQRALELEIIAKLCIDVCVVHDVTQAQHCTKADFLQRSASAAAAATLLQDGRGEACLQGRLHAKAYTL